MNGETSTRQGALWVLVVVALILGGIIGYYLGTRQAGSGLVDNGSVVDEISDGVDAPVNPFEEGGYQNPFEEVNVNPFAQ